MTTLLTPPSAFQPNVVVHDEIGSTNAEAMRLALLGEAGPLWIQATRQTAGRGRSGRAWVSETGNLTASLLTTLSCSQAIAHQVSLLAGVAVVDAVRAIASDDRTIGGLRLKWPNDVLIGSAKLAGVLPETTITPDGRLRLVLGIGINLAWHPETLGREATHLSEHSMDIAPESMLRHLAWAVHHWFAIWNGGAGFDTVRAAWLLRAGPVGEPIVVHLGQERRAGHFAGLDHDGALLLETVGQTFERITFGDVTLLADVSDKGRKQDG